MDNNRFEPIQAPKVEPAMIVRLLVLLVAVINGVAAMLGFDLGWAIDAENQESIYQVLSGLFLAGSSFWAAWKNNNVTKQARIKEAKAKK